MSAAGQTSTAEELAAQYNRDLVKDAEQVCGTLRSNGTYDLLRKEMMKSLTENEEFKQAIAMAVQKNTAMLEKADLNDKQVKKAKLEELKRAVEPQLTALASTIVRSNMLADTCEIGQLMALRVHEALCSCLEQERASQRSQHHQLPAQHNGHQAGGYQQHYQQAAVQGWGQGQQGHHHGSYGGTDSGYQQQGPAARQAERQQGSRWQ